MSFEELKALDHQYTMQPYARFDVALDHGEGATLWDVEGRPYIDFTSGIGVCSLGYGNTAWAEAIYHQAMKLGHISNLYYTEPYIKVAQQLCTRAGMQNVFFANSGAESNEGMIKIARKYSYDKYGKGRGTVITLKKSFHGRTLATLTATGQDVFHNYFHPFPEGFRYAEPNDLNSLEEIAGHDVCAIMLELIQGEGGVNPLDKKYVQQVAELCQKRDWLLLIDEVQTGVGRTGSLFAFQQFDIMPDAVSFAKGIAGGMPFGGVLAGEKCKAVFTAGTHGTTFGGNPMAAAAALEVLNQLDDTAIAEVNTKGDYLRGKIEAFDLPCLGKTRGMGMMIGIDVIGEKTNKELAKKLCAHGLLILTAGAGLRMLPPLTISYEEMDKGLEILRETLSGEV